MQISSSCFYKIVLIKKACIVRNLYFNSLRAVLRTPLSQCPGEDFQASGHKIKIKEQKINGDGKTPVYPGFGYSKSIVLQPKMSSRDENSASKFYLFSQLG